MACNWTQNSSSCGVNGCVGVLGTSGSVSATPAPALGDNGNVFYGFHAYINQDSCYIKSTGLNGTSGWLPVSSGATNLSLSDLASATTIDPGTSNNKHRPPLEYNTDAGAFRLCQAQNTEYGNKRLLRRREFLVATPLPYIAGEDNATLNSLRVFNAPLTPECNPTINLVSGTAEADTVPLWLDPNNSFIGMKVSGNFLNYQTSYWPEYYLIGSPATKACLSRFGIQDPLAYNWGYRFSDTFVRTNSTSTLLATLQAATSDYDAGATDFSRFTIDGTLGPLGASQIQSQTYFNIRYTYGSHVGTSPIVYPCTGNKEITSYIPPVGMAVCTWSGNAQTVRNITDFEATGQLGQYPVDANIGAITRGWTPYDSTFTQYQMAAGAVGGGAVRWSYNFIGSNNNSHNSVHCALEAE